MVVCRARPTSGDAILHTWNQLKDAFKIEAGHGRLKNNFATAGMDGDDEHNSKLVRVDEAIRSDFFWM